MSFPTARLRSRVACLRHFHVVLVIWVLGLCIPGVRGASAADATVRVFIEPEEAVAAGAHWTLDADTEWRDSGTTATAAETHRAVVGFSNVHGWRPPEPQQVWVFNGLERTTTATYRPIVSYAIGEIPWLQAYEGEVLSFGVYSTTHALAGTITLSGAPTSATLGLSSDDGSSVTIFSYLPEPGRFESFDLIFTAVGPGAAPESQTVRITPIPDLPDEESAFGMSGLTFPGAPDDEEPKVVIERIPNYGGEVFNLSAPAFFRKVTITGDDVVFDEDIADGLYDRFHYTTVPAVKNADIKELTINARRVIVRSYLRFPGAQVTINALELRFEDGDSYPRRSIATVPVLEPGAATPAVDGVWDDQAGTYVTPPTAAGQAKHGGDAGNVTLRVASIFPDTQVMRFDLEGGRGQNGGAGFSGKDGRDLPYWGAIENYTLPSGEYFTYGHITGWAPPIPFPIAAVAVGTLDEWPGIGEPACPASEPGDGGKGGGFSCTLQQAVSRTFARTAGGEKGWLEEFSYHGGSPGVPKKAHRIWVYSVYGAVSQITRDDKNFRTEDAEGWSASNETWYGDMISRSRGDDGALAHLSEDPTAFLLPAWVRENLHRAREQYLFGDIDKAEERLSMVVELIDVAEDFWGPDAEYTEDQMDLLALRDEMRAMQHRIYAKLDYFGNPPGWVPMLSFEVNKDAFATEIDHALNLMYLSYWAQSINPERRLAGLQHLWEALGDEARDLQQAFADLKDYVPVLHARAVELTEEGEDLLRRMTQLEQDLREQATQNLLDDAFLMGAIAGAKLGLRVGGTILQAIPVAQPVLGAIGGLADVAGQFDYQNIADSIQGSVTGAANVATTYTDKLYNTSLTQVEDAITLSKLDPKEKDKMTRMQKMRKVAKTTAAVANGVAGVTSILGEFELPMPDIEGEIARLKAESDAFTTITLDMQALAEKKMELVVELTITNNDLVMLPNLIMRNMLAMNALQQEIDNLQSVLSPGAIDHLTEIDRRARERLLKYHYYMARAYEYRLLRPYEGQLDLQKTVDDLVAMADASSTAGLTQDDFEALRGPFEEEIRAVAETIFTLYNDNRPELSAPVGFRLTDDELARLNTGDPVKVNLMEMGLFPPSEENIRLVDFRVDDLAVHLDDDTDPRWATLDIYMEHSGISKLQRNGEVYNFRHYNPRTENPIVWGTRYDHFDTQNPLSPIAPSAASDSLLRSLLTGEAAEDLMLYSRPSAWADIVLTKRVNAENDTGMTIDSLRLEVVYDFTPSVSSTTNRSRLSISVYEPGFKPLFQIDTEDLLGRQNARGRCMRTYSVLDTVSVTAPKTYGNWVFEKWTGPSGQDIGPAPTGLSAPARLRPVFIEEAETEPWTDPTITVDMTTHRSIRAQYTPRVTEKPLGAVHWELYP